MPGKYKVTMSVFANGILSDVAGPVEFEAKVLNNVTLPVEDRNQLVAFQKKVYELRRALNGAIESVNDMNTKIDIIKTALRQTENAPQELTEKADIILQKNKELYFSCR